MVLDLRAVASAVILLLLAGAAYAQECAVGEAVAPDNSFPQVALATSAGKIVVELDRRRAPLTVNNFLGYVTTGAYDGSIFHRVVADFVVQGGGRSLGGDEIPERINIFNESGNGLRNDRGAIAMARLDDPHSASNQFYFNLKDNDSLNPGPKRWGYTVFGYVIEGLDVLDAIGAVATNVDETPQVPVLLETARLVEPGA